VCLAYGFLRILSNQVCWSVLVRRLHKEGANVNNAILALATYVGHTQITATYWYITGIPELMALAAQRFQRFAPGGSK
jgi:hypothetical protein